MLYRLVSRLGMHLSKLAVAHPWITPTFTALTEVGTWLLNIVAILLFLGLIVTMANRSLVQEYSILTKLGTGCAVLLLFLTVGFLFVPPAMLGSVIYNSVALLTLSLFMLEYLRTHQERAQRILGVTYLAGHFRVALLSNRFLRVQPVGHIGGASVGVRIRIAPVKR